MTTESSYPRRRARRLAGFDYSTPGAYFVTIGTEGRIAQFGQMDPQAQVVMNKLGQAVAREWHALTNAFPTVSLGEFVVMPNHFHGIIWIREPDVDAVRPSLTDIVARFKPRTNQAHLRLASERGERAPRLWQRGYHDRVIRDERELEAATAYIAANAANWHKDKWYVD